MSATNGIPAGLASVIVPCFNQLEFTRHCLTALFRHTRAPWELIVVDNGSTDGTADYLAGVQDASPIPITVVTNPTNRGYPTAVNQGLSVALGDYLVLLDNDAVVTDGWLDQLVALAGADPTIGLTGPMSNSAMSPQLVEHVPYARPGADARLRRQVEGSAPRSMVHRRQAVGVLPADEAGRL